MFEQGDEINLDSDSPLPPEQSNRTFKTAAGIMKDVFQFGAGKKSQQDSAR